MTYVIGDIHGELGKLSSLISNLNLQKDDTIIFLGDYIDRGPDSCGVIEYLLDLNNKYKCVFIKGNHDDTWMKTITASSINIKWLNTYCAETISSYEIKEIDPLDHLCFFEMCKDYHIIQDTSNIRLFVHGGFLQEELISSQNSDIFYWDRHIIEKAVSGNYIDSLEGFTHIYLGHTPTQYYNVWEPMFIQNVILMDTGVGKYIKSKLFALEIYSNKTFTNV